MATRDFPSLEEIEAIPDIFEFMEICDLFGVPWEDLDTAEEFIERLTLEFHRRQGDNIKAEVRQTNFELWMLAL